MYKQKYKVKEGETITCIDRSLLLVKTMIKNAMINEYHIFKIRLRIEIDKVLS